MNIKVTAFTVSEKSSNIEIVHDPQMCAIITVWVRLSIGFAYHTFPMALLNGHMLYVHIGIASMRQFQSVPTTYVTEIKETYFEIYTKQVSCPGFPLLNISNC